MEDVSQEASPPVDGVLAGLDSAIAFLNALFNPSDTIIFRPIETWVEDGKKRSRVDYKHNYYRVARPSVLQTTVSSLLKIADTERLNLFFGTCPRGGTKGRFDLAWQIRIVRALWTDIDYVTVDEARERVAKAGLPPPSIIVNSGNGAHLYWLLDAPYVIDDAGAATPVETEWLEKPSGRKKSRKYIVENGDKVYLDERKHVSRLSTKAEHIQDVLAGIAKAVGGDNTTDLSRLLRLPGSLNRKDQRNGREPVPTALVECDPTRKYSLATFEPLKSPSPASERAKQIATMPLPKPRKVSTGKADKLNELVAACAIAEAGTRSEADFALCCYAIRSGVAKEEVWAQVSQVGKFAEQGERYFDITWDAAEYDTRAATYDKLRKSTAFTGQQAPEDFEEPLPEGEASAEAHDSAPNKSNTIVVDTSTMPVAETLHKVTDRLLKAGNCFSRTEQLVVIHDDKVTPVLSSPELAGLLNEHVEFYFVDEEGGEYKPFPSAYANTWLNQRVERGRLPTIKLFTRNPVYSEDWRLVAPGFDAQSGIYYAGPEVAPRPGTEHLDTLLREFCFKRPADRTNYLGMLLTAVLMPRFIGSKPAALFNGNQPELGKSILAQIIAILRDGNPAETASYNANDEEFEKRLGAIVRRGVTTIIIDNAKARGRNPRIESACLERSITDPVLSFRLLGYSQEIRAENSHIFAITANSPDVSRDLLTRSVIINLYYEGDPERRSFSNADPEGYAQQHRFDLLGELLGMVERWKAAGMPMANIHTRFNKRGWGNIVGGILAACGEPDFMANASEAAEQLDDTRREFAELVAIMVDHQQGTWTPSELIELSAKHGILTSDLGEGSARSRATKMGTIAGRFVGELFSLSDERSATFHKGPDRKGSIYFVRVPDEMPNLAPVAEPMPNLASTPGSAP